MSFGFKRTENPGEDQSWLASKHATGDARTTTLVGSAFSAYLAAKRIPSGIALTENAERKSVPATSADQVTGFLFTDQIFDGSDVVAPLLWHAAILPDRLPEQKINASEITNPQITVVGVTPVPAQAPEAKSTK